MSFEKEFIPDGDRVFRRIDPGHYKSERGEVSANAFKGRETSVNWEKYATPAETARPDSALVVAVLAKDCRDLDQEVVHDPISEPPFGPNQAHSLVIGEKGVRPGDEVSVKLQLMRRATRVWENPELGLR